MLEEIILGLLLEKDMTGYEIKKYLEEKFSIFYTPSYGSLYPALKRLTNKGQTSTYENDTEKRNKCYYSITQSGKETFFEWLVSPVDINDGHDAFLLKVYFFDKLPHETAERRIMEYELNIMNYLDKLKALEEKFRKLENKDCFYFKLSTLYYGICITEKKIEWCRHIRQGKPLEELTRE